MRVGGIFALNVVALVALARIWPRGASADDSPPESVATSRVAPTVQPLARRDDAGRRALERELRALIARYVATAGEISKGKVRADNVNVALHVRAVDDAEPWEIAIDSELELRPASNLKLVTTAAALALLGPGWNFETRFETHGALQDGRLEGDLVVRGCGDPLYDPQAEGQVDHLLAPALDELIARGIRAIRGDVVLDEGTFLAPGPGPEWPDAGQHWAEYCALSGALSANRGCLTAHVSPTREGSLARVAVFPQDHGLAENFGVRTDAKGRRLNVQLGARSSGVLVRGTIPLGSATFVDSFAHPDPVELMGHALCAAMARRGILVEGRLRRERGRPGGTLLATIRSPLVRYLDPINTDSTNAVADQVFLATAYAVTGEGTRDAGARATKLALDRLGVPSAGLVQVDGSGLSRSNRVSARQIVALIDSVLRRDADGAQRYAASLAVAGETGTLSDRMGQTAARGRVRAKTGFIAGTSALSGIATTLDGRRVVFSCLVNYPDVDGLNTRCWKKMQDDLCTRLVEAAP